MTTRRPSARWALVLSLALAACGDPPRTADPAPAAPPVPDVAHLARDRSPALLAAALAADGDDAWPARLEAMRQIRHQRPPGLAPALEHRVLITRSEQEQAIALDVLFTAYPAEAAAAVARIQAAFAGEQPDLDRLATAVIARRCVPGYPAAVDLLEAGGESDLIARAGVVNGAGAPLAVEFQRRAALPGATAARHALDLALAALADPTGDTAVVDAAVVAAQYPPGATAVALARPLPAAGTLARQAWADGVVRPEVIDALARAQAKETAPALLALVHPGPASATAAALSSTTATATAAAPEVPLATRAACLRALGAFTAPEALPDLLFAAGDSTVVPGESLVSGGLRYGGDTWPLAEAALAGLATMPGDQAWQALLDALVRTDRPAVVVAAADALARRGDPRALPELDKARAALDAAGDAAAGDVTDAMGVLEKLNRKGHQDTEYPAYLVRYRGPDLAFTLVTDQPLIPSAGLVVARNATWNISQESFAITAAGIASAIQLRNSHHLDRLRFGPDAIDEVDLLAR